MGEGGAVDDHAVHLRVGEGGDLVHQLALVVALEKLQFRPLAEFLAQLNLEIGEGGVPVDFGFALAEAVEVGAVQDGEGFHGGVSGGLRPRAAGVTPGVVGTRGGASFAGVPRLRTCAVGRTACNGAGV